MENIKLIRKIAWSFSATTGLEFDDLFQEASLAYLEALKSYDETKGKITTYAWWCITNHLKNYIKVEEKHKNLSIDDVEVYIPIEPMSYFEKLSNEAQDIASIILSAPSIFDRPFEQSKKGILNVFRQKDKVKAKKKLINILKVKGWDTTKINHTFKELSIVYS